MAAGSATLGFKGIMMDPLNFEAVEGPIKIVASKLGDLMKICSADIGVNPPMVLAGAFKHDSDHWDIRSSKGKIATSALEGDLSF